MLSYPKLWLRYRFYEIWKCLLKKSGKMFTKLCKKQMQIKLISR